MGESSEEWDLLAERLRILEDEREIVALISSYGPAVDSGQGDAVAAIWTESGVYDTDMKLWQGRAEIATLVDDPFQQQLIAEGSAHVIGVPRVRLKGDKAVATCYSRVFRHVDGAFQVWRVSFNLWDLERTPEGWRAAYRTNRLINGSDAARALLRRAAES